MTRPKDSPTDQGAHAPVPVASDIQDINSRLTRIETRLVKLIYALGYGEILEVSAPDRDRQ